MPKPRRAAGGPAPQAIFFWEGTSASESEFAWIFSHFLHLFMPSKMMFLQDTCLTYIYMYIIATWWEVKMTSVSSEKDPLFIQDVLIYINIKSYLNYLKHRSTTNNRSRSQHYHKWFFFYGALRTLNVCIYTHTHTHTHIYTYIYLYIYIYIYIEIQAVPKVLNIFQKRFDIYNIEITQRQTCRWGFKI